MVCLHDVHYDNLATSNNLTLLFRYIRASAVKALPQFQLIYMYFWTICVAASPNILYVEIWASGYHIDILKYTGPDLIVNSGFFDTYIFNLS